MPILKTHNLSVADFTENENIYYLFPDNWSHQKGSNIVRILRDSDHGIPLYTGLSPIKPFDEERGMKQLDESLEIVKNILMQKGLVIVLINEFYQDIDYDHGGVYEKEILDSIHEILNIGCPKDVKVTI
jgi:hypothetical protein|tara:strand:+ start:290 stop:676 length:387 start_codon:yes stop_codon:yes gene_type:complete